MLGWRSKIFLIFLFGFKVGFAQIRFVDDETQLSVPALNIYHEKGTLIGFTDKDGVLRFLAGTEKYQALPLSITVQHISYEDATYNLTDLHGEQVYMLNPRTNSIEDIIIQAKPKEIIVLKGYFRSLETFYLQHKYFADGLMEFYIPVGKGKPKYRLLDYRVFRDSNVVQDYDAKMGPFFQIARVAELHVDALPKRLMSYQVEDQERYRSRLLKDGIEVGHITTRKEDGLQMYIDLVLPDTVKKEKIFRLEALIKNEVHVERYSSSNVAAVSYADLQSTYQNLVGSIKRKKELGHVPYEGLNEFYVLERSFISLEEYKTFEKELIRSIYKTPEKSRYSQKYWENLDEFHIPSVQSGLAEKLGKTLKLVE